MATNPVTPFSPQDQLFSFSPDSDDELRTVPGHPYLDINDSASLSKFLVSELSTKRLRDMYPILFLTSKPRNISPLHHQAIKGRRIIITERAELHLITYPGRILIKPLPRWLTCYAFCEKHLFQPQQRRRRHGQKTQVDPEGEEEEDLAKEAHGFLRTYATLIQHESDLDIAKREKLIPPQVEWDAWCRFIKQLKYPFVTSSEKVETEGRKIRSSGDKLPVDSVPLYGDSLVSPRYHYGEIGLVRLNLWCFLAYREWEYLPVHYDYGTYFARYLAPYLFLYGGFTVILTAMQVELAARPTGSYSGHMTSVFVKATIVVTIISCLFFPVLYLLFGIRELYFYLVYFRPQV